MAMDVEHLIECVKAYVYLYDLGHKDYRNMAKKTAVWEKIAHQLNENSETVKLKWKTIRDGYIKYKKQLKEGVKCGRKVITYIWSAQLKFLDDYQVSRKRKTPNLSLTALELSEDEDGEAPSQSYSPESILIPSPSDSGPFRKEPARLKRKDEEKNESDINNKKIKTEPGSYDATDHLFLSYSETFKTFSPRQRALLKVELAKLFSKAELNALDNDGMNLQESFVEGSSPGYGAGRDTDNTINVSEMCTVDVDDYDSDDDEIEIVNPALSNGRRSRRNRLASDATDV